MKISNQNAPKQNVSINTPHDIQDFNQSLPELQSPFNEQQQSLPLNPYLIDVLEKLNKI